LQESPSWWSARPDALHRTVLKHPLGGDLDAPPAFGKLPHPLGAALPGLPTDGGFGSVDVGNHDPRAQSVHDFMFIAGASDRFVGDGAWSGMRAESIWPGGTSAAPGSLFYLNLLPRYLTNDTVPLLLQPGALSGATASVTIFVPAQ